MPGVVVVDAGNPAQPVATANLTGPSMLIGTWESLKVTEPRKLLGGVAVGGLIGAGFFDVYDVSDCAHPVQLNGLAGSSLELPDNRSEEHTSELQSLMRISYAVFCLKKKIHKQHQNQENHRTQH